jgi:hypothetical protein
MNWYKESQQVAPLGADDQGKLTLNVNGEVREYQLPYTAVGSYQDIAKMIRNKQIKKLDKYLQWLEQFQLEEVKNMNVGVGDTISKEENLAVVPGGI